MKNSRSVLPLGRPPSAPPRPRYHALVDSFDPFIEMINAFNESRFNALIGSSLLNYLSNKFIEFIIQTGGVGVLRVRVLPIPPHLPGRHIDSFNAFIE